jgi:hypothetical protein
MCTVVRLPGVNPTAVNNYISYHIRAQRETMIRHIGMWPTSKQDLINKHQKIFSWFVESVDFDGMQQIAQ